MDKVKIKNTTLMLRIKNTKQSIKKNNEYIVGLKLEIVRNQNRIRTLSIELSEWAIQDEWKNHRIVFNELNRAMETKKSLSLNLKTALERKQYYFKEIDRLSSKLI